MWRFDTYLAAAFVLMMMVHVAFIIISSLVLRYNPLERDGLIKPIYVASEIFGYTYFAIFMLLDFFTAGITIVVVLLGLIGISSFEKLSNVLLKPLDTLFNKFKRIRNA